MIDELVFKKAQKGDWKSFYELVEPIKGKLYRSAFIYFKNENDAMDALSDTLVKAINSISSCKSHKSFNAWICTILINTCKNNSKKISRAKVMDFNNFENELTYEETYCDEYKDIYDALDVISEAEKDLIVKRYIDDMKISDISKVSNIPIGTIKSRLNRTLKKLRVILGGV